MNSFVKQFGGRLLVIVMLSLVLTHCARNAGDIALVSNYKLAERAYRCDGKKEVRSKAGRGYSSA